MKHFLGHTEPCPTCGRCGPVGWHQVEISQSPLFDERNTTLEKRVDCRYCKLPTRGKKLFEAMEAAEMDLIADPDNIDKIALRDAIKYQLDKYHA